jgi:hypothetical protein
MSGRKPEPLWMEAKDNPTLQQVARSQTLPWYQVRRARIVLSVAQGQRIQSVALQMQCSPRTVRRTFLLYQENGLPGLLIRFQRPGRPARISSLQRAQIVQLACPEPVAKRLHITHWPSDD